MSETHLVHDPDLGDVVAYASPDAAKLLGLSAKSMIARVTAKQGRRAELRGWAPGTDANPNRAWMIDAAQVDRLGESNTDVLRTELAEVRSQLAEVMDQRRLEREAVDRDVQALADESATIAIERSTYQQSTLDAAHAEVERLRGERDQARAAVLTLGETVASLTAQLTGAEL